MIKTTWARAKMALAFFKRKEFLLCGKLDCFIKQV